MIVTEYDLMRCQYTTRCTDCGKTLRTVTDWQLVTARHPEALMSTLTIGIKHDDCPTHNTPKDTET